MSYPDGVGLRVALEARIAESGTQMTITNLALGVLVGFGLTALVGLIGGTVVNHLSKHSSPFFNTSESDHK